MPRRWIVSLILTTMCTPTLAQTRTRDGATVGGVAGAVIGGIIGHQNDETPEGALIGGAVGALAGGLLGKVQDNDLARQRYAQQQAYYAQQRQQYVRQQQVQASGVSMADVVNMSRSGVSEPVILSQLNSRGVQRRVEVSDIISLHQQGVSDTIITAMQQAPLANHLSGSTGGSSFVTPAAQSREVIVQQPNVIVRESPVIYQPPVVVERRCQSPYRVANPYRRGSYFRYDF